ncbi:709_t:CDS:2 [Gigaspora margarita]|uniref:709_t:CDS:1 n=1 Tax=Gigaspora margarita TaxID=4874 RepID=A0ABN7W482_GIGMA|nr:709_t:CDS:2 [Gigaspora margarita]
MIKTKDSKSSTVEFKEFLSQYLYSPLNVTTVIPKQSTTTPSIVETREKSTRETVVKLKACSVTPYYKPRNNFQIKEIQNSKPQSSLITLSTEPGVLSVPDIIDFNLKGKRSAETGHHFAHHSNHFYPCLVECGATNNEIITYKDDQTLINRFRIGIINVVNRYTRSSADLSTIELRDGIPSLLQKVKFYKPKILCFIGKCAFDAFEYTIQSNDIKKKSKNFGLQSYQIFWNDDEKKHGYTKVFVIPSTSARVKHYQKSDKLKYFKELKEMMDQ